MHPLIEAKREQIIALGRQHGAKRLWIFGSATRDDFDDRSSDVDFLVDFADAPRAGLNDRYFKLIHDLEDLLGHRVDLLEIQTVQNPYLLDEIEETRIPLYAA